jgi:hypothetical protein
MAAMPGSQIYRNVANTYRVAVDDVIARERAKLGLPVAGGPRAWSGPQEALISAASEADAWSTALALFPPAEGYRVESVRLAEPGVPGSGQA